MKRVKEKAYFRKKSLLDNTDAKPQQTNKFQALKIAEAAIAADTTNQGKGEE